MGFFYKNLHRAAHFNGGRTHRFTLTITWDDTKPTINFIGCNPSTADEKENDPTITRVQSRAAEWGYGELIVTNCFSFRSPYPAALKEAARKGEDVVGMDDAGNHNDYWIKDCAQRAKTVLCGWGTNATFLGRADEVRTLLKRLCPAKLVYLKLTEKGEPQHPLYIAYELTPKAWRA